jgi:bifunctional DNA-binding transcriptional regulator/antitoxin component of YhaV-PrlF toxin-antitoxin module
MALATGQAKTMTRRKTEEKNVRKIFKSGESYTITLPLELVKDLNWREKQKVVIERTHGGLTIKDWKE